MAWTLLPLVFLTLAMEVSPAERPSWNWIEVWPSRPTYDSHGGFATVELNGTRLKATLFSSDRGKGVYAVITARREGEVLTDIKVERIEVGIELPDPYTGSYRRVTFGPQTVEGAPPPPNQIQESIGIMKTSFIFITREY